MEIPTKRLTSGFEIPVYGLGTWQMGGRFDQDPNNDDKADIEAIREAIEFGIKHIDTAEVYAHGHAEELVGQAIRNSNRKDLFLTTKVYQNHLSYGDVIKSAHASLKRLDTDYLDLYLIHLPNPDISLSETMKAMDYLIEQQVIRNIGVSNFSVERMKEAQSYTRNTIVTNQVHYNLKFREPEVSGLLSYCQKNDIILTAYRPVQKGILTSGSIEILDEMARVYDKTPAQIAINWLISQKNVVTLSKTSNIHHLRENIGAIGWKMKQEDIETLQKQFPDQQPVSDSVPLQ